MYLILKQIHLSTIVLTLILFLLRAIWMLTDSPRLQHRWVKIVPHINDTLLLISAIAMTLIIDQYPFVDSWLTAKVLGLLGYIVLGTIALKRGRTKAIRATAGVGALLVFAYIVTTALLHDPFWLNSTDQTDVILPGREYG